MTMEESSTEVSSHDATTGEGVSGATSPGTRWGEANGPNGDGAHRVYRHRPRTFPYSKYLPYPVESQGERETNLETCIEHLYVCVAAGDFAPGATHWTRELRSWLSLKFDLPLDTRVRLVKLYYELCLAPGLDFAVAERFASMFMVLTKRKHYLRPGIDLTLDWRPLYRELKLFVFPADVSLSVGGTKRNYRTLTKLCTFSQLYFDPREIPAMLEEFLPYFSTSIAEGAFIVAGLINLLLPTLPPTERAKDLTPQNYLPTIFHLWSLVNRSKIFDTDVIDLLSRLARDSLSAEEVPFGEYGIFTKEQSALVFTAVLRMLEIPVEQSMSPYSSSVDGTAGIALILERDRRKHPTTHHIARWIVLSLSPSCLDCPNSVLTKLEGLIQAVETFYHPSNVGSWTKSLSQLAYYLSDFFIMRWHREASGEMEVPEQRRLTPELRRRFVLCLKDVVYMGIFAKSSTAVNFSLSTMYNLALLEPDLILPGALQRIYPAMSGLVEVHRTISAIRALQILAKVLCKTRGYRCHITTLLVHALPGIDANDLDKTLHTLSFIQSICYCIPFKDLTQPEGEGDEAEVDSGLALRWVAEQVDKMEMEGPNVELNYTNMDAAEEEQILRSSTAGFSEFLTSFLGRVFTLLENLPDASRVRSGSPEENVVNTLPATFTPLLAALSPALFKIALNKVSQFVTNHVIHQARDAMAFICNALVKVSPQESLERLLPDLISGIREEIGENGAGSTRTTGTEVLPRDRSLVWNISLLSMCVVHVGDVVLRYRTELLDLAAYMQENCKGIPTVHVSNFVHHLLLNLTVTYIHDYTIYTPKQIARGLTAKDWGAKPDVQNLEIQWHVPRQEEIDFAIELFEKQAGNAIRTLDALTGDNPPIKFDGTGKDWSDEVSRNLVLLRLITSGVSVLFDTRYQSEDTPAKVTNGDIEMTELNGQDDDDDDEDRSIGEADDEEVRPTFQYSTGYPLERGGQKYHRIHQLRDKAGHTLHRVHEFLVKHQEDDVTCFNSLYNAYKSWFVDVGIERSAHVLDRVTRLFTADISPFKASGLRKDYPRSLLVRRAYVYHLQRLRHNANPRHKTELDEKLLLDLAQSSVSLYTEIRRTAQSAGESAIKCIIKSRSLIIKPLLDALEVAVKENDFPRIKGAMFSLMYGSLAKSIGRNWRLTPRLIKAFIEVAGVDKPSVQKIAANVTYQMMDMGRPLDRMIIVEDGVFDLILPTWSDTPAADLRQQIATKREFIQTKRDSSERKKQALAAELIELVKVSHWKKASRAAGVIVSLNLRYEHIASEALVDLMVKGSIDSHPTLRGMYSGALVGLFSLIQARALTDHSLVKFLKSEEKIPEAIDIDTASPDSEWTGNFLKAFASRDAEYLVDQDYPGWLVWGKKIPAFTPKVAGISYDDMETKIRKQVGDILDRHWFSTFFAYMKQEPRDAGADRFRMTSAMMLMHAFELVFAGLAKANFDDLKDMAMAVYGDGSDKHQHRATAEIMGALISISHDLDEVLSCQVWDFVFPLIRDIFRDGLTPENLSYWITFLKLVFQTKDPRRNWRLLEWLAGNRLDRTSNAAFKESSKIQLLQQCVMDIGWHFQLRGPTLEDFLKNLDHPYKGVREAVGQTISTLYRTQYHESYPNVDTLVKTQKDALSIGTKPYQADAEFIATMEDVLSRMEVWRKEREPGQQQPSSYTMGCKTVLLWLDSTLASFECIQLVPFFPGRLTLELLHMMDVKEDPELQALAYHVFRHLPNIPHRDDEEGTFVDFLLRTAREASSWHQRLRVLINVQVIFFRRLFLMSEPMRLRIFDTVADMLSDTQLEVRVGAGTTLSGMVRCSPVDLRQRVITDLKTKFTKMLADNPLPKGRAPGTPTPEHNRLIRVRHAAVLGLGALIQAFPYTSPPPTWLPDVLATLAVKAAGDPGVVGRSVKSVLSDFKKTRQDTWQIDMKVFQPEQLEDLEGVLWKSYFA